MGPHSGTQFGLELESGWGAVFTETNDATSQSCVTLNIRLRYQAGRRTDSGVGPLEVLTLSPLCLPLAHPTPACGLLTLLVTLGGGTLSSGYPLASSVFSLNLWTGSLTLLTGCLALLASSRLGNRPSRGLLTGDLCLGRDGTNFTRGVTARSTTPTTAPIPARLLGLGVNSGSRVVHGLGVGSSLPGLGALAASRGSLSAQKLFKRSLANLLATPPTRDQLLELGSLEIGNLAESDTKLVLTKLIVKTHAVEVSFEISEIRLVVVFVIAHHLFPFIDLFFSQELRDLVVQAPGAEVIFVGKIIVFPETEEIRIRIFELRQVGGVGRKRHLVLLRKK
tara:strand:+ start:3380 stop:4390 length:1011 start_codon:yes stop_codon:yes gene_type:complete